MTTGQLRLKGHRARLSHEKEARRQAILAAAAGLLEARGFEGFTMADVAAEGGFAKGTIYIYYKTKEEIFLELLRGYLLSWFEALDEGLRAPAAGLFPEPLDPPAFAGLLLEALEAQPGLPRLLAILHTVLEPRADRLAVLRFKEFLADRCLRTGRLLEQRLPFFGAGDGAGLLLRILGMVLGYGQMSDPPPQVRQLLAAPGLQVLDVGFRPLLEPALRALLLGLEHGAAGPGPGSLVKT